MDQMIRRWHDLAMICHVGFASSGLFDVIATSCTSRCEDYALEFGWLRCCHTEAPVNEMKERFWQQIRVQCNGVLGSIGVNHIDGEICIHRSVPNARSFDIEPRRQTPVGHPKRQERRGNGLTLDDCDIIESCKTGQAPRRQGKSRPGVATPCKLPKQSKDKDAAILDAAAQWGKSRVNLLLLRNMYPPASSLSRWVPLQTGFKIQK